MAANFYQNVPNWIVFRILRSSDDAKNKQADGKKEVMVYQWYAKCLATVLHGKQLRIKVLINSPEYFN